jgi:hypothetical protein
MFKEIGEFLSSPGGAAVISGAAGLASSYLGGKEQARSTSAAMDTLKSTTADSLAAQERMYKAGLELGKPYRDLGEAVLPLYQKSAIGDTPAMQTLRDMAEGDLYEWQKKELTDSLNSQLAARGLYNSGAGLRTLSDAYRALGAEEAERRFGRQKTLADMSYGRLFDAIQFGSGQSTAAQGLAANQGSNIGATIGNLGSSLAPLQQDIGNARASMYSGANQAIQGGLYNYHLLS